MHGYVKRLLQPVIEKKLQKNPVTTILGPCQCGKSTLANHLIAQIPKSIYLDLERHSDLRKLDQPELFFKRFSDHLICLDEIQRKPEIFTAIRSFVDQSGKNNQFLILGSASRDLIKQSSESLAGRIAYLELTPFFLDEIETGNPNILWDLWLKGGFPRSYLEEDIRESYDWRENFIKTFLERDLPQFGFNIPAITMERFWRMLAHVHGQIFNRSKLGESLGVSYNTVRNHLSILIKTFIMRELLPLEVNIKKRLIKAPKIYIRDSGLLHTLLEIETQEELFGNPVFGHSWEGFVVENILNVMPRWRPFFYRTSNGMEIDLVLIKGNQKIAIECKTSEAPKVSRGFRNALNDLDIKEAWIITPMDEQYDLDTHIHVSGLFQFIKAKRELR